MPDDRARHRLIVLAFVAQTEPAPYGLLVSLILASLEMDYFAFQTALNALVDMALIDVDHEDHSKVPTYRLNARGREVFNALHHQLPTSTLTWLLDHVERFRLAYEHEGDLPLHHRAVDGGFAVSLGAIAPHRVQLNVFVRDEVHAKRLIARYEREADRLSRLVYETLCPETDEAPDDTDDGASRPPKTKTDTH